ncbi:MAG: transporter, partial [Rhodopirellula sp. JB044]|uniref:transporter n=1 Tax=Rhodopirellula sp. JB044 TaxID=3342844 RepID=UPI00370AB868
GGVRVDVRGKRVLLGCMTKMCCYRSIGMTLLVLVVTTGHAYSQDFTFLRSERESSEDEIETDRDSFTPATTIAGEGRWIVEAAYSFIDNRDVPETHSYPELLVRHGVNDWLELRLGWNYEVGGAGSPVSGNVPSDLKEEAEIERESRIFYGGKVFLMEQADFLPEASVLLQGFTPTSGEETQTTLSATYIFGWELKEGVIWDSAVRYSTSNRDEDQFNVWSPSTVVKVAIGERWKAHAEYFGVYTDGREEETAQYFFSPGAHYLVTSDFEVGCRVGWGLNDNSPNFFSNVGIGYRY